MYYEVLLIKSLIYVNKHMQIIRLSKDTLYLMCVGVLTHKNLFYLLLIRDILTFVIRYCQNRLL